MEPSRAALDWTIETKHTKGTLGDPLEQLSLKPLSHMHCIMSVKVRFACKALFWGLYRSHKGSWGMTQGKESMLAIPCVDMGSQSTKPSARVMCTPWSFT